MRLRLLHAPQLVAAAVHPLPPKDAALLAMLALDGPTPRARIAAMLWPAADAEGAHNNLRQRLFRLRRAAGREVVVQGATLALAPGVGHEFDEARRALDADPTALAGELLGACAFEDEIDLDEWVRAARERWRAARRDLLSSIAAAHERADRVAAALPYAERLVRDEPLAEHAARLLMRLHYRRGDRATALAVYERLRTELDARLGETPAGETQQLAGSIEASIDLPVAVAPLPPMVLRPPRLVGRETAWRTLDSAWAEHRLAVVSGEPGIGKTRLLGDFLAARGLGEPACCRPGDSAVPYAALARWLRWLGRCDRGLTAAEPWARAELARVAPELGPAAPGVLQSMRLQAALEHMLERWAPAVVAIDDLHFADSATLDLLPGLVQASRGTRWLLAMRRVEAPGAVAAWLERLDGPSWTPVELGPLDAAGVSELLTSLDIRAFDVSVWAPRLYRHTGGNPMFILETLLEVLRRPAQPSIASDDLPVPANLGDLMARRLGQLSERALQLARVAAVAGTDWSPELAAHVMRCHVLDLASVWHELEQAHVTREARFAHDVVAESVLRTLPGPIAGWLHRAVAEYGSANDMPAARLAGHWEAAGELRKASASWLDAARHAADGGRIEEHVLYAERAADLAESCGDSGAAFDALRWLVIGSLSAQPGRATDAIFDRMARLAQGGVQRGEAWRMQAIVRMTMWDFSGVVDAADRAIDSYAQAPPSDAALGVNTREILIAVSATRSVGLARAGRCDEALAAIEPLRQHWADATLPAVVRLSAALESANVLASCDHREQALPLVAEAVELARGEALAQYEHAGLRVAATTLVPLGRTAEAYRHAAMAVAMHERMGAGRGLARQTETVLGGCSRDLGRYAEALTLLEAAVEGLREQEGTPFLVDAEYQLALTWLDLGRSDRIAAALTPPPSAVPAFLHAVRRLHHAWLVAAQGGAVDARIDVLNAALAHPELKSQDRLMIELLVLRSVAPSGARGAAALALAQRAIDLQLPSLAVVARAEAAEALCDTELAEQVLDMLDTVHPLGRYRLAVVLPMLRLLQRRVAIVALAEQVEQVAATQVPEVFRTSFLQRNPVNRALLAAARRLR